MGNSVVKQEKQIEKKPNVFEKVIYNRIPRYQVSKEAIEYYGINEVILIINDKMYNCLHINNMFFDTKKHNIVGSGIICSSDKKTYTIELGLVRENDLKSMIEFYGSHSNIKFTLHTTGRYDFVVQHMNFKKLNYDSPTMFFSKCVINHLYCTANNYNETYYKKTQTLLITSNSKHLYHLDDVLNNNSIKKITSYVFLDELNNIVEKHNLHNDPNFKISKIIFNKYNSIKGYSILQRAKSLEYNNTIIDYKDIKDVTFTHLSVSFTSKNTYNKPYIKVIKKELFKIIKNKPKINITLSFCEARIEEIKIFRQMLFTKELDFSEVNVKIIDCNDNAPDFMNNNMEINKIINDINKKYISN